jgi:hypothetical protein
MSPSTTAFDGSSRAALADLLRSRGFDLADFEISEDEDSELVNLLGLVGGIVSVRRISTGEVHSYATGAGSAWFGALLMDMARGRFAPREPRPAHA